MSVNISLRKINKVIGIINAEHNTGYKLLSRFPEGAWGAYRVSEPGKQAVALKFFDKAKFV